MCDSQLLASLSTKQSKASPGQMVLACKDHLTAAESIVSIGWLEASAACGSYSPSGTCYKGRENKLVHFRWLYFVCSVFLAVLAE